MFFNVDGWAHASVHAAERRSKDPFLSSFSRLTGSYPSGKIANPSPVLRHANATLLDAVKTPPGTVQAILGHSSAEITR